MMNKFGILKRFLIVWIVYWLLYYIQPVRSEYTDIGLAWLLQLLFVLLISIFYCISAFLFIPGHKKNSLTFIKPEDSINAIRWGLRLSFLGLILLTYDKIIMQGIDYFSGLAQAREQWRQLGEDRDAQASSIFSALGYLFGGAFFLPLGLVMSRHTILTDIKRFKFFILCFVLLIANSLLTGGRSAIFLAAAFVSFGYFSSKSNVYLWRNYAIRYAFLLIGLLTLVYILYVFSSRAKANDLDITLYSLDFLSYLNLLPESWFENFVENFSFGWIFALLNLATSYLTHSLVTTAAIIGNADSGGDVIFGYVIVLISKLGFSGASVDWFLSGRFPSMPGALYLQFGIYGLIVVSIILGLIAGLTSSLFTKQSGSLSLFLICASIESILLMSPFLFAGDLLFFPFMVTGSMLVIISIKIFNKNIKQYE
jgi:oligosaccharide repeat unit polymerase